MELKDLLIFESVVSNGSISKAANELNYVQSHVTARIKALENQLNTKLFDRHSRGTTMNAEGRRLLSYTEKILSLVEEMNKEFHDTVEPSGMLEIGTIETVQKLPYILSMYHRNFPNVELTLKTGVSQELIQLVLDRKLDGAFVTGFSVHPELEQVEVFREELVLISDRKMMSYDSLKAQPILVFNSGCSYRARLESWLADCGITNAKVMEFGTQETILGGVMAGLGISIIPKSAVRYLKAADAIHCYPLPEKYSDISTVFIRKADSYLSSAMDKFMDNLSAGISVEPPILNAIGN